MCSWAILHILAISAAIWKRKIIILGNVTKAQDRFETCFYYCARIGLCYRLVKYCNKQLFNNQKQDYLQTAEKSLQKVIKKVTKKSYKATAQYGIKNWNFSIFRGYLGLFPRSKSRTAQRNALVGIPLKGDEKIKP